MTENNFRRPRAKRPHPARTARILSTGAAASLTFGVIAGLAVNESHTRAEATDSTYQPEVRNETAQIAQVDTTATPTTNVPRVVVVRRVHVVPAADTTSTPVVATTIALDSVAVAAPSDVPVFAPKPVSRSVAPQPASSRLRSRAVVRVKKKRTIVAKRKVAVRKAKPATRAS